MQGELNYPRLTPLINKIADWWRSRPHARAGWSELANCGADEMERIAADMGLCAADLRRLVAKGPDAAALLRHMMTELRLDPAEIQFELLRDLQRVCAECDGKVFCAKSIADGSADTYQDFCPNAVTLRALQCGTGAQA